MTQRGRAGKTVLLLTLKQESQAVSFRLAATVEFISISEEQDGKFNARCLKTRLEKKAIFI